MSVTDPRAGRLVKAPENFLSPDGVRTVFREGKAGRRDFIRSAFAAASAAVVSGGALAQANPVPAEGGDPNILNLPGTAPGLGQPVATDGYGKPSQYEANVQRRQSPGPDADHAVLGVVRAAAEPVRHRHARAVCISSATTRAGGTSIRPSTA